MCSLSNFIIRTMSDDTGRVAFVCWWGLRCLTKTCEGGDACKIRVKGRVGFLSPCLPVTASEDGFETGKVGSGWLPFDVDGAVGEERFGLFYCCCACALNYL